MIVHFEGLAPSVQVGGPSGPVGLTPAQGDALAVFSVKPFDETAGHAIVRAMEVYANGPGAVAAFPSPAPAPSFWQKLLPHVQNLLPVAINYANSQGLLTGKTGAAAQFALAMLE